MSMVSHLHQLFNAETCQSYIHTLRWKDRPLQCPRCQSHNVGPWGTYHYQPGLRRYRCKEKDCKRTFNDLTGTLLDGSKRSVMHWILATFLLCLSCSSRRIARELGVHMRTGYRWCWWLRNAALSYEMERQLEGTVEADDLYHTAGQKGQATQGGKNLWAAARVGAARNASPVGGTTTKTDRPSSPGSVAREQWLSRRPEISRCRRSRRLPTSPSTRAVGCIRTRPAAIGRSRAMCMTMSTIRRRNMHGARSMRIGPSVCFPYSSRTCGCFGASAKPTCQGMWASSSSCATFIS